MKFASLQKGIPKRSRSVTGNTQRNDEGNAACRRS